MFSLYDRSWNVTSDNFDSKMATKIIFFPHAGVSKHYIYVKSQTPDARQVARKFTAAAMAAPSTKI